MDANLLEIKSKISEIFNVDDDEIIDIFEKSSKINVLKDFVLFSEGKHSDNLYIIGSGLADIFKSGEHINSVGKGDLLGEMSLVGVDKSTATVVAKTDMVLFKFKKHRFELLLNKYPKMNQSIVLMTISRKIQQQDITAEM